ncbi:hypothetical protein BX600DRAFT_510640 [Xylariales sp. PMI_506]|nr:hypothetical protein BX600DRAFT_510640 [Xylariales sp. PMI_506]
MMKPTLASFALFGSCLAGRPCSSVFATSVHRPSSVGSSLFPSGISGGYTGPRTTSSASTTSSSPQLSSYSSTSTGIVTTSAAEPTVVVNVASNGNFAGYDPNWRGGISGWNSTGDVQLLQGYGYIGGGSADTACVQMIVGGNQSTLTSRQAETVASIEQYLEDLDELSNYTMRFYYTVLSNTEASTCLVNAYYGTTLLQSSEYFPVVAAAAAGTTTWVEFITSAALSTSDGFLDIEVDCSGTGSAEVLIDQVFISNQVTTDDVDNISLLYTVTVSSTSSVLSTTTSSNLLTSQSSEQSLSTSTDDGGSTTTSPSSTSTNLPATTTSDSTIVSATAASVISATTTAGTLSPTSPTFCVAAAAETSGLICGKGVYTYSDNYKSVKVSDITEDQCAAACLADEGCQSFVWFYENIACSNQCVLESSSAASYGYMFETSNSVTWDRGCFTEADCSAPADDTVCVDKLETAADASCASFEGTAVSCATPMLSTTVSLYCGMTACRDLCMQYTLCESFSFNYNGYICDLYTVPSEQIATVSSSSGVLFADRSCYTCGEDSYVFDYLTLSADPSEIPDLRTCSVTSSSASVPTSTVLSTVTSAETTAFPISTSSPVTTATTASTSLAVTSTSCVTCFYATPVPTYSVCELPGTLGFTDIYTNSNIDLSSQTSDMECAAICAADSECGAYALNVDGIGCAFSHLDLTDSGFVQDDDATWSWSDLECASCISDCSQPTSSIIEATSTATTSSTTSSTSVCAVYLGQGCEAVYAAAPSGSICGTAGSFSKYPSLVVSTGEYPYQSSPAQCAALCLEISGCVASGYDQHSNDCNLGYFSLAASEFTANADGTVIWSDNACYDCACTGPSSTSSTPTSSFPISTKSSLSQSTPSTSTLVSSTTTSSATPTTSTSSCASPTAHLDDTLTCGLPGVNGVEAVEVPNYTPELASTLAACAAQCLAQEECLSFMYYTTDDLCSLYATSTAADGLTYVSSSTIRYYDRGCFVC